MKKLFLIALSVAIFSCESESDFNQNDPIIDAVDRVAVIMSQDANPEFDDATDGLYKGIIASYDLALKGTIVISMVNNDKYEAAAKFHKGTSFVDKVIFEGIPDPADNTRVIFTSDFGSFTAEVSSEKRIVIEHFTFNGRDSYINSFKKMRGADVQLAFGTYVDDLDAAYNGNWDAIHSGQTHDSSSDLHSPISGPSLKLIDFVVVTRGSSMITSSDTPAENDSFSEDCFYNITVPHAYYYSGPAVGQIYREFIGYNQTSTFGGRVATWSLAYYSFDGLSYVYDTPACNTGAGGFGTWSWDGRAGKLYGDVLPDL